MRFSSWRARRVLRACSRIARRSVLAGKMGAVETAQATIAALATAPGPARRGVLRLSGPGAGAIVRALLRADDGTPLPPPRRSACRAQLADGRGTQPLGLLWMPGPASYTGEDVAELHLCGSPPLLRAALAAVLRAGARLAQPGEFTRRALLAGKLDFAAALGVLALIEAENEDERRAAGALLWGGLRQTTAGLREALADARALCEAALDFSAGEAAAVPPAEIEALIERAHALALELRAAERARAPQDGLPRIVLTGQPNAGKSALFNALLARGVGAGSAAPPALVSAQAGTTRDALERSWRPSFGACRLVDTPGVETARDELERAAQGRGAHERASAQLLVLVLDGAREDVRKLEAEARALPRASALLVVWNKLDLPRARELQAQRAGALGRALRAAGWSALRELGLSALSGEGLADFERCAGELLAEAGPRRAAAPLRELALRHTGASESAFEALERARAGASAGLPLELVAEELRSASDALDAIDGHTGPEDLLDRIFARFCLGK
jgi:tRNA modification GTPase